jgi:hypothetical protein
MIETCNDGHRRQWKTYCDSCGRLLGDTGPGKIHVPLEYQVKNECPYCHKEIFINKDGQPAGKKQ